MLPVLQRRGICSADDHPLRVLPQPRTTDSERLFCEPVLFAFIVPVAKTWPEFHYGTMFWLRRKTLSGS